MPETHDRPRRGLTFDATVSMGNVFSMLTMAAGLVAIFVSLSDRLTKIETRLDSHELEIREVEAASERRDADIVAEASGRESRLRAVEVGIASTASDVRSIQAGINRIEAKIDDWTKTRSIAPARP